MIQNAQIEGIRQSKDLYIHSVRRKDAAQLWATQAEMVKGTRITSIHLDAIQPLLRQHQTSSDSTSS